MSEEERTLPDMLTEQKLILVDILTEQQKQTKYLGTINTVMQLFGLLLLLSIAGMICNLLGLI